MDIEFRKKAEEFVSSLPYKQSPYGNRNWGHPWHSLCSYHGKLKPAIAHWLISEFTSKGDVVLDPLCGVGTIPFEACLHDITWKKYPVHCDQWQKLQDLYRADMFPSFANRRF